MINFADLERLTKAVVDVVNLAGVAADMVAAIEAGDDARVPMLGAVLRALRVQASALHQQADVHWMDACRAEQSKAGGAA
jgi:hypothetical protein